MDVDKPWGDVAFVCIKYKRCRRAGINDSDRSDFPAHNGKVASEPRRACSINDASVANQHVISWGREKTPGLEQEQRRNEAP
jgi:hypothetical protein